MTDQDILIDISRQLGEIKTSVDELPEIKRKIEKNSDAIEEIRGKTREAQGALTTAKWVIRFILSALGLGAAYWGLNNGG